MIIPRVPYQPLAASPIDSLKAKVARIGRQWLIAIQPDPARRRARESSQSSLFAADLHFRRAIHYYLEGAFPIATSATNIRPNRRRCLTIGGWN